MSDWQPIETAPKDGTLILIGRAGDNVGCNPIEITYWYRLEGDEYVSVGENLYRKERRVFSEGWNGNGHRATHWMPLPKPPTGPDEEDPDSPVND